MSSETEDDEGSVFVMVYDLQSDKVREKRKTFENNLCNNGVILSKVRGVRDPALCFVQLTLPWELLLTYADIMKMKMPLKATEKELHKSGFENFTSYITSIFELPYHPVFLESLYHLSVFRKDKMKMFQINSKNEFFSVAQKILIANEILSRTQWSIEDNDIGVRRLVNAGVYLDVYPLHEGKYKSTSNNLSELTQRQILYRFWAHPLCFYKYQPIPLIRKYFGEKITIYFEWLGFYSFFLVPPSIIGLLGFIYSISTFGKDVMSQEICNINDAGSFVMCPLCNEVCDYWKLSENCIFFKIAGVIDNDFTIFFSIFMSLWGTIFLHFWIRKEKELQCKWNTNDYEEEELVRHEFEIGCKNQRKNPVTNELEWYMTRQEKVPRLLLSFLSVLIMVGIILGILIGVILLRILLTRTLYKTDFYFINSYVNLVTSSVTATINLCAILILNHIYRIIAIWLTNLENPRTETEYDDSFTLKMYTFQFLNFYSSIFYIAFFKGIFTGRPGNYLYTFGMRQEECDPAGCMVELCIQMLIIFVGKQILNNVLEYTLPFFQSKFFARLYQFKHRKTKNKLPRPLALSFYRNATDTSPSNDNFSAQKIQLSQWEKDFYLVDSTEFDLFDEYLEMFIQFGFVAFFAAAMPLAPLFALVNNIIELRLDALKMLTRYRRPIPRKAQDIGIWFTILQALSIIAVVTNGFIISYTSNAIPRMVYRFYYTDTTWNLNGYVNFTLSVFNISDFETNSFPIDKRFVNLTMCRYKDFRNGPQSAEEYNYSPAYWHVLAARLAFVIIFEHVVFFIITIIRWIIPEMPKSVKIRMEQEKLLNLKLIYKEGKMSMIPEDLNTLDTQSHLTIGSTVDLQI